jgi:hypothetical protein
MIQEFWVHQKQDHQTWHMDQNRNNKSQVGTPSPCQQIHI